MIRVVVFLIVAGLLALGVVWLADRPGQVAITWLGYRADTSVMVGAVAIVAIAVAAVMLWGLARFFLRSPKLFSLALRERKRRKGYEAISRGLIAIGAGDARAAQRFAANAEKSLPSEPLALLLRAQAAQLHGDRAGAEDAFRAMAGRDDTRLLGLRGLYVEAQRRNDPVAARLFAEQAAKDAPALAWAGQAVLEFRCAAGDWEGALAILEGNRKSGVLDRAAYRRQRAVLLTARALAAEENDRDAARRFSVDATKLAPGFVPAAALAGRLLAESGERRKAAKIIEAAWKANPHPDLAEAYAHVRLSDSARDRLSRVQALARMAPGHPEGALAVARAALDAREFTVAREALGFLLAEPTQRVAMLMAELEQLDGDDGRAREWMGRALNAALDPAWTADGFVSDRWLPVSPVTGRLDAFQWKVPVSELGESERMPVLIEAASPEPAPRPELPRQEFPRQDLPRQELPRQELPRQELPRQELPREVASPPLGNVGAENGGPAGRIPMATVRPALRAAPIIPLAQIPDDPGPEPEPDVEVTTEPKPDMWDRRPWQRIRQLFR